MDCFEDWMRKGSERACYHLEGVDLNSSSIYQLKVSTLSTWSCMFPLHHSMGFVFKKKKEYFEYVGEPLFFEKIL